ncbi:MAG: D-Ala-D-Ala carboxypeptidase family metallohydrolase [Maricaulaceae bacterium]
MLWADWRDAPWDTARWPNFTPAELACRCAGRHCVGEFWFDPGFFDALQRLRDAVGRPLRINSAHRCGVWNAIVGGAPLSAHRRIAVDVALAGHDRFALYDQALASGFRSFGFYQSFLHMDQRPGRRWWSGERARRLWMS